MFSSLDSIYIQVVKNNTNINYKLGYSNLTKDDPYQAAEKYTIGGFQFEHDHETTFLRELKTWDEMLRHMHQDGQLLD